MKCFCTFFLLFLYENCKKINKITLKIKILLQNVCVLNVKSVILQPKSRKQKQFVLKQRKHNDKKTCADL